MKKLRNCVLALLCPIVNSYGQPSSNIQPLRAGDTLSEIEFAEMYRFPDSTIRLSDFKDKLVILDYWATWCGSCVKTLPKMDSLQRKYSKRLQVLLVSRKGTGDDTAKVSKVLTKLNFKPAGNFSIPILLNDTFALRHYQLMVLPHYIWIDKNRVIRGITDAEQVNSKNIEAILKGKPVVLKPKEDMAGR